MEIGVFFCITLVVNEGEFKEIKSVVWLLDGRVHTIHQFPDSSHQGELMCISQVGVYEQVGYQKTYLKWLVVFFDTKYGNIIAGQDSWGLECDVCCWSVKCGG